MPDGLWSSYLMGSPPIGTSMMTLISCGGLLPTAIALRSENTLPAGMTLLIRGGRVLTPDTDWHQPPAADIAVAGDSIVGVAGSYRVEGRAGVEVIDARDHLVLPGFINAHYHSHDVL